MNATIYDPDPDPNVEAARLAYIDAKATADAHYAVAYAASGGELPDPGTELGFIARGADHDSEVAYEQFVAVWRDVYLPKAHAADPEIDAERELERSEGQAEAEQELEP